MRRVFGFTLIELLIVIAVISILVGITVPRFLGMRDEANTAKAAGETSALKAAVEAYRIHKNFFPNQTTTVNNTDWEQELTDMSPKLVESALMDPFDTSNQYSYATDAASNSRYYVIFSVGPNSSAEITGINTTGNIQGNIIDDIYATNGR